MYCQHCGLQLLDGALVCDRCGRPPLARTPIQSDNDPALRLLIPVGVSPWAIAAGYAGMFAVLIIFAPSALILGLVAFLFAEDAIVHDERGADYLPYVRTWSTDLRYAHRVTEHALWDSEDGMTAVVALGREANIGRTVADIQRDTTESMQVAMFPFRREGEHWGMVARASGGTKGTALEWIARHYGIGIDETVCVGDWLNDLAMMTAAGRSFAMGQAPDEVKSSATDTLERTIETGGGIAEAIEKAFG